jgi:hypothetical protein
MEVTVPSPAAFRDSGIAIPDSSSYWPLWRKMILRFFFIYFFLYMAPWTWLDGLPYITDVTGFFTRYYYDAVNWSTIAANNYLFHISERLTDISNGSGDRSYDYVQVCLFLLLAFSGMIIWSLLERKRRNYSQLNYWLCLFVRYYIAMTAFAYGIIKLFALQMPFPGNTMLATNLGDLLPMRLSWMFIGYSAPYQIFSGAMEVLTGVLLLYRRTTTMGVLLAMAVFSNVMMMNLAYDIPVKLYSMHLVLMCLFLLVHESKRILCFFVLNRPAPVCMVYQYPFRKRWMRIARIVLKTLFIILAVGWVFYTTNERYREVHKTVNAKPFRDGMYDVTVFVRNGDTIPALVTDSLRWQDMAFDGKGGSIRTTDTSFIQRYRRARFLVASDTVKQTVSFLKSQGGRAVVQFRYAVDADQSVRLWGRQQQDSLFVVLKPSSRHFQLAERQFHWISEANR